MKSDVPWQLRGVSRQTRETALEAARRSGMTVGEWLDSVILDSALRGSVDPGNPARAPHNHSDDERDADRHEELRLGRSERAHDHDADDDDDDAERDADVRPRLRKVDYDPRHRVRADDDARSDDPQDDKESLPAAETDRSAGYENLRLRRRTDYPPGADAAGRAGRADDEREPLRPAAHDNPAHDSPAHDNLAHDNRPSGDGLDPRPPADAAARRADMLAERLSLATLEDRYRPLVDRGFADVNGRLDSLTRQLDEIAEMNAAGARTSRPNPRDEEAAHQLAQAISQLDRRLDQLIADSRVAKTQIKSEMEQELDRRLGQLISENRSTKTEIERDIDRRIDRLTTESRSAKSQMELDIERRLDQLMMESRSAKIAIEQRVNAVDRAVADLGRERPRVAFAPDPPTPLDQALIEIAERQRLLDGYAPIPAPIPAAGSAPYAAMTSEPLPRARTQELSGLEQQLRQINSQIETLRQPCGLDKAVDTLRNDLAEIGVMLQDAMPRKAIEALEGEVRSLVERVDHTRHASADEPALPGIERGLAEVRDALRALTPAESLVGVDQAVQRLADKIDLIANTGQDPASLRQLEGAIATMRGIASHVASNDALARLSDEVRALADKVDRAAGPADGGMLSALEQRIATLADALEARNQRGQVVPHELDTVVKGLIDKIERVQLAHADPAALGQLEDRIAKLVEKLDASDARLNHLETIERGLAELLMRLEQQRVPNLMHAGAPPVPEEMETLSRDVADLRQSEKKTLDTLEAVHGTLGHVVDRLAMIETDIRSNAAPMAPVAAPSLTPAEPFSAAKAVAPELPPRFLQPSPGQPSAIAASPTQPSPSQAGLAQPSLAQPSLGQTSSGPSSVGPSNPGQPLAAPLRVTARSAVETPSAEFAVAPQPPRPTASPAAERRPIDPSLPPDHPLEPGSGASRARVPGSPADRIAASEAALAGAKPPVIPDPAGRSNFIAAARRAAQAAGQDAPSKTKAAPGDIASAASRLASRVGKLRSLIAGGSAVLLVLGSLGAARVLLGPSEESQTSATSQVATGKLATTAPENAAAATHSAAAGGPPPSPPPTVASVSSLQAVLPAVGGTTIATPAAGVILPVEATRQPPPASTAPSAVSPAEREITGSVPAPAFPAPAFPASAFPASAFPASAFPASAFPASAGPASASLASAKPVRSPAAALTPPAPPASAASAPASDKLPGAFAPALRAAAVKGDAAAQYEVATRYAEGRGVQQNLADAAEWFERAAKQGLAPAQFRLGGLYEKGLGVKKDIEAARRLYLAAGEAGNGKALHNLAVLYAEGVDGKPDYQTAAKWFRKAAEYGVADSQYNLAILYARGIGMEQNLSEAYKWFALAAREGDADAAKKRDEIGAHFDQQSLKTAAQAVETWLAQPQPETALRVKAPTGGWGEGTSTAGKRKPPAAGPAVGAKLDLATPRSAQ
jgi:localization factor PodJL